MKKMILFLAFFCQVILTAYSQNPTDSLIRLRNQDKGDRYIGFNLGGTTGIGFSNIYWPKKHGFQVTLLPIADS